MLEIKNLTKIYPNGKKAVSDLSITIEDGDLYGFIGKNGAGKTTTLKACLTIHDYDTGDILLNGVSIKSAPTECKKLMAYVPDTPILDPYLTGLQYLNFICDIYSVSKEKRQQKIPALSKKLGITYQSLHSAISGNPKLETLQNIADALEVDITELFATDGKYIRCPNCGKRFKMMD